MVLQPIVIPLYLHHASQLKHNKKNWRVTQNKMKAKVNTKNNYRNLNGQWLEVKEVVGTRVSCVVETEEYGKQTIDFKLSEVTEMNTTGTESNLHPVFADALKPFGIC